MSLRSNLGKARGLGSAKEGSHHWLMQRITAITLLILVTWFVVLVVKSTRAEANILETLGNPLNAIIYILLICVGTYHGVLGFQVVIEDYVHKQFVKNTILIFTKIFAVITASFATLALIYHHVNISLF